MAVQSRSIAIATPDLRNGYRWEGELFSFRLLDFTGYSPPRIASIRIGSLFTLTVFSLPPQPPVPATPEVLGWSVHWCFRSLRLGAARSIELHAGLQAASPDSNLLSIHKISAALCTRALELPLFPLHRRRISVVNSASSAPGSLACPPSTDPARSAVSIQEPTFLHHSPLDNR